MENQKEKKEEMLHGFDQKEMSTIFSTKFIIALIMIAIFGVGSGYLLAKNDTSVSSVGMLDNDSSIEVGTVVGSSDTKTFRDSAEGVLEEGGIEGEGQYHLVRPGGDSQNVYLTSSVIDLSIFIQRKVKVWGETNAAKSAGWLMDVGKVEVLE
ncbi:MAG: hypothetical protein HYV39_04005 [Candidatus Levybacteria bacterium]|nr:hypothetical protein [Candidatus Levybacteria bacterium]